jgi:hypothetical protein
MIDYIILPFKLLRELLEILVFFFKSPIKILFMVLINKQKATNFLIPSSLVCLVIL